MNGDYYDPPVDEDEPATVLDHVNTLAAARRHCTQRLQSTWGALGACPAAERRDLRRRMTFYIAEIRRLGGEITRLKVVSTRE
jgi:hypothetical protein